MKSSKKTKHPGTTPASPSSRSNGWGILALVIATLLVYWPALRGGFVWDDDAHISSNATLQSWHGLKDIWLTPGATMQYYPLSFSIFWLDYHLWGFNPLGYHLQNVLLHSLVAVLLWQVLKRLRVPGAWLAGAIFALHPVNVMSVAWMTELKNTLSSVMALSAAWAYLRFARLGVYDRHEKVDWRFYALSLFLFMLAMCAKTAVSFLPVSLLLVTWWQRSKLRWQDVWPALPMFLVVLAMGRITFYVEQHSGGASGPDFNIDEVHRILISGRSFWFYLGKLFFPVQLTFIYPRWHVDPSVWWQWLFPLAMVALFIVLWRWRGRWGKGPVVALLHFFVCTSMLILMVVLFMTRYSFVSDHWQYFGSMGVIALASAAAVRRWGGTTAFKTAAGMLLALLSLLSWRQAHMYSNLETLWRTTIQRNPEAWMSYNNLGIVLLDRDRVDEAIIQFQKAFSLKPDYADAHNNLGAAYLRQKRADEAAAQFQLTLAIQPNYAQAHYNLGNAFLQEERLDDAIGEYRTALSLHPDYPEAWNNLGNALGKKGLVEDAIDAYQQAIKVDPRNADAHNNLGNALLKKGRVEEAIDQYQKALAINPGYTEAHNNLGNALQQRGQQDQALEQYRKAVAANPSYAPAHYNLGNYLMGAGHPGEAIEEFRKAIALQPDYVEALSNLGSALLQQGQLDEALVQFRKAAALRPQAAQPHNNLGQALQQKGQLEEAIGEFKKAMELAPQAVEPRYNLGMALLAQGKLDEAMELFRQVLAINPDYPQAHYYLGNVLLAKGKTREAIAEYQRTLELSPDNVLVLENLGTALMRDGQLTNAMARYRRALEIHPENAEAAGNLGLALFKSGHKDEALAMARRALSMAGTNAVQLKLLQDQIKMYQGEISPAH